jgi:hypothetical protein
MPGVVPPGQHHGRLHEKVNGQGGKRTPDQPQAAPLPISPSAGQFPDHHRGRPDLDQGVQAEPGQSNQPGGDRRDREDDDPGDVPSERDPFQSEAAANQYPAPGVGRCGHG